MSFLDKDTWVVPETFSFISRVGMDSLIKHRYFIAIFGDTYFQFCQILALCCILLPEKGRSCSAPETLFVLSCGLIFFLNCFEFIGSEWDNLMVHVIAVAAGLGGILVLLATANPGQDSAFYDDKVNAVVNVYMQNCSWSTTFH